MDVMKVSIDIHGSPCKSNHTRAELVLKILKVRHEQALGVGADLVDNAVILSQDEVKFRVVHLELVLLQKHNFGTLRDVNTNSG